MAGGLGAVGLTSGYATKAFRGFWFSVKMLVVEEDAEATNFVK